MTFYFQNSSNLFDFENFTPELRIDGQSYSVSQVDFENLSYLGEGACGNVQVSASSCDLIVTSRDMISFLCHFL